MNHHYQQHIHNHLLITITIAPSVLPAQLVKSLAAPHTVTHACLQEDRDSILDKLARLRLSSFQDRVKQLVNNR